VKSDDLKTFWEHECLRKSEKGKHARVTAAKQRERETRKTGTHDPKLKNTTGKTETL
jgi:hypothetical protein